MATPLSCAIQAIVGVFQRYSEKEGDKYKLNNKELRTLLQEELPGYLENDNSAVEKIMKGLDSNADGEVDFQEFLDLVAVMTCCCHEFFVSCQKKM